MHIHINVAIDLQKGMLPNAEEVRFSWPAHTRRIPPEGQNLESKTHIGFKASLLDPLGKFWSGFTFREQWPQMKANSADAILLAAA